ncbi:MAG: hypothetical protein J7K75_05035, partial [Desulfuromonas sp.]|nr:hypothetical protein [Desulfuromonas sp.]
LPNAVAYKKRKLSRPKGRLAAKVKHNGKRLIVSGSATPGGPVFKAISLLTFFGALQRKCVGCGTKPAILILVHGILIHVFSLLNGNIG